MIYVYVGLILILFIFCLIKNISAYDHFVSGAKEGLNLCVAVFPYLVAIFVAVELFRISGLALILSNFLAPFFLFLGIPPELCELIILRPFSGSGSIAIFKTIVETNGADSYISRTAGVVASASETLFYITAVYFSTIKSKKLGYAIPVALFSSFIGTIVACLLCKVL